jgi:hypothetical protein
MRKRITLLIAALMLALTMAFGSMAAFAISPQDAEEAGCTKERGTVSCETTDLPGNSDENTQGNPPETTVTDETKGNLTNKSPEESQDLADNECEAGASPGHCRQAQSQ